MRVTKELKGLIDREFEKKAWEIVEARNEEYVALAMELIARHNEEVLARRKQWETGVVDGQLVGVNKVLADAKMLLFDMGIPNPEDVISDVSPDAPNIHKALREHFDYINVAEAPSLAVSGGVVYGYIRRVVIGCSCASYRHSLSLPELSEIEKHLQKEVDLLYQRRDKLLTALALGKDLEDVQKMLDNAGLSLKLV